MSSVDFVTCFSINSSIECTFIDDEAVLMGEGDDTLFGLNAVGTEIFKQLQAQPLSLESIVKYLLQLYDVDESQCVADTTIFIESLFARGLIIKS